MRKLVSMVLGLGLLLTLSACGVSDEDLASCTNAGGQAVEKSWPTGENGWLDRSKTHEWQICEDSMGRIVQVFEIAGQTPADPDHDFLSYEGEFARKCLDDGGAPWRKYYNKYYSYICVNKGEVTRVKA